MPNPLKGGRNQGMFGAYDESVRLNEDLTFLPGSTYPFNTFTADTLEKGVYTYSEAEKILTFKNDGEWVYKVVHWMIMNYGYPAFGTVTMRHVEGISFSLIPPP